MRPQNSGAAVMVLFCAPRHPLSCPWVSCPLRPDVAEKPKHIQHQVLRLCQALNSGRSEPLLPPGTQSLREPYIHDSLADSLAGAPAWLSTLPPSDTTPGSNSWGASLLLQQQEHQQFALPGRGKGRRRQEGGDEGEAGEQWRSGDAAVIGYGEMEALAYVCSRMPSCYGATARVLSEVTAHLPSASADQGTSTYLLASGVQLEAFSLLLCRSIPSPRLQRH